MCAADLTFVEDDRMVQWLEAQDGLLFLLPFRDWETVVYDYFPKLCINAPITWYCYTLNAVRWPPRYCTEKKGKIV